MRILLLVYQNKYIQDDWGWGKEYGFVIGVKYRVLKRGKKEGLNAFEL